VVQVFGDIWEQTEGLPRLGDLAGIHRGVELPRRLRPEWVRCSGSIPVLQNPGEQLSPYLAGPAAYLQEVPSSPGGAWERPWGSPKLLISASAGRTDWRRVVAAPEREGLVVTQRFYAGWLREAHGLPSTPEDAVCYLAAVLNGPLTNVFVTDQPGKGDLQKRLLERVPVPVPPERTLRRVAQWVRALQFLLRSGNTREAEFVRTAIDRQVLRLYDLAPMDIQRLLKSFGSEPVLELTARQQESDLIYPAPLPVDESHPWAALVGDAAVATGRTLKEAEARATALFPDGDLSYFLIPAEP
jgi:hypothetical protein